jgi:outer membrane protein
MSTLNRVYGVQLAALTMLIGLGLGVSPAVGEAPLVIDLQKGIDLALERNEQILMSQVGQLRAKEQVREARAAGLPQINAVLDYDRNWLLPSLVFGGNKVKIGSDNNITSSLSLRQTLYSGGRVAASKGVARWQLAVAKDQVKLIRQQIVAVVETRFYDLLVARELRQVSELALQSSRVNLGQVQARRRAGRASELDALRAGVQVTNARVDSIRNQNDLALAEMSFKDVIGLSLDAEAEITGVFRETSPLELEDLPALVEKALVERPELSQLQHRFEQHKRTVAVERAGNRPTLELIVSGQSQFQSDKFDVADQEWRKSWGTGLLLQVPLFDGMRTRARVAKAKTVVKEAGYERGMIERRVRLEVERDWLVWREVGVRIEAQNEALRQAEKGLEVAQSRYRNGAGTQLEVLDAHVALVDSRTDLALARRERALSLMMLERSVGVLAGPISTVVK